MKSKDIPSSIYGNNFTKREEQPTQGKIQKRNGRFGGIRRMAAAMNNTAVGHKLIDGMTSLFPNFTTVPNNIFWLWNRFRNPTQYYDFADDRQWVFIVGCSNSGTSVLHDLLAAHPDIASMPLEGQSLTQVLPRPKDFGLDRRWSEKPELFTMTEDDLHFNSARLIHDWKNCLDDVNASIVIEKTPLNVLRTRWLQSVFKNSYFIGITRDGRAVAEGINRRSKDMDIQRAANHWMKVNEILLENAKYLKNYCLVRYEELVENPEKTIADMLSFIKVGQENYYYNFNDELIIHNIDEEPAKIKNFNQKSFERISNDIFDQLTQQIKPMMIRLGYSESNIAQNN